MRLLKVLLCLAGFFCTSLESAEFGGYGDQEGIPSIIDLQGHPNGIVDKMVNVITGHLVDGETDFAGVGPKPIAIQRYYNSGSSKRGTLCDGWDLNLHQDITFVKKDAHVYAIVSDRGSQLLFTDKSSRNKFSCKVDKDLLKWGVTNGTKGVFSGRANISNRLISYHLGHKHAYMRIETGEEVILLQKKQISENTFWYTASQSKFPDGCTFDYDYNSHKQLLSIVARGKSKNLLDSISFTYPKDFRKNPVWKLQTNTGDSLEYHFQRMNTKRDKHHYRYMLAEVKRSNAPDLKFKYSPNYSSSNGAERLTEKQWPEGKFLQMEYYEADKTTNGIHIGSKKDSRVGRVSALYAPAGVDNTPVATQKFFYFLDKDKKSGKPIGGKTEVVDARRNKKVFHFSSEHRLTSIEEFDSLGALHRRENFYWGVKGDDDYTCLLARVLEDEKGIVQMYRGWSYDARGNIVKEVLAGNLTGKGTVLPQINSLGGLVENGCEKHVTKFSYTPENFWPRRMMVKSLSLTFTGREQINFGLVCYHIMVRSRNVLIVSTIPMAF